LTIVSEPGSMLKQKLSKTMRAAVDCQPGTSHSIGHGKRREAGDAWHGSARFIRVKRRNGLDDGGCGLLEDLANFWQNGFLMTIPLSGESENSRVFIGGSDGTRTRDLLRDRQAF
jgi:hypothetical protein